MRYRFSNRPISANAVIAFFAKMVGDGGHAKALDVDDAFGSVIVNSEAVRELMRVPLLKPDSSHRWKQCSSASGKRAEVAFKRATKAIPACGILPEVPPGNGRGADASSGAREVGAECHA